MGSCQSKGIFEIRFTDPSTVQRKIHTTVQVQAWSESSTKVKIAKCIYSFHATSNSHLVLKGRDNVYRLLQLHNAVALKVRDSFYIGDDCLTVEEIRLPKMNKLSEARFSNPFGEGENSFLSDKSHFFGGRQLNTSYVQEEQNKSTFLLGKQLRESPSADYSRNINLQLIESRQLFGNSFANLDAPTCRTCYSTKETLTDPIIRACVCAGSIEHVHYSCLARWIKAKSKKASSGHVTVYKYNNVCCELCKMPYPQQVVCNRKTFSLRIFETPLPPYAIFKTASSARTEVSYYVVALNEGMKYEIGRNSTNSIPIKSSICPPVACSIKYVQEQLTLTSVAHCVGLQTGSSIEWPCNKVLELILGNFIVQIDAPRSALTDCSGQTFVLDVET